MGFGLMDRFTGYSQVVSTSNYSTLRITVTTTHRIISSTSAYSSLLGNTSTIESSILNPQSSGTPSLAVWISDWTSFMWTEYRIPSRIIESSVVLCCHETYVNLRATSWFLQAYSLPLQYVSTSRCLATDVSVVLFWLHTSGVQASCHNIFHY
jgi:hypothetical protein